MAKISEILAHGALNTIKSTTIQVGSIFLGPMPNVNHDKFYIIAGMSGDKLCVCSVVINSAINPFILKRPKLLERQVCIFKKDYSFLTHDSYINCASPLNGRKEVFDKEAFVFKEVLRPEHLKEVVSNIIASGTLTKEEVDLFFGD